MDDDDAVGRGEGAPAAFEDAQLPPLREDVPWKTEDRRPRWRRDVPVLVFLLVVGAGLGLSATLFLVAQGQADPDAASVFRASAGVALVVTLLFGIRRLEPHLAPQDGAARQQRRHLTRDGMPLRPDQTLRSSP